MTRDHGTNDCLSCCVAYILNVHPLRVPFFIVAKRWRLSLSEYFRRRGRSIRPVTLRRFNDLPDDGRLRIVQGKSPRNRQHAVVFRGRKIIYDPNWKGGGLVSPSFLWKIGKLAKATD